MDYVRDFREFETRRRQREKVTAMVIGAAWIIAAIVVGLCHG